MSKLPSCGKYSQGIPREPYIRLRCPPERFIKSETRGDHKVQEEQTVSFSPMYVDGPEPWFTRLFELYLLTVLVVFSIRIIKLLAGLRSLRRARKDTSPAGLVYSLWVESCEKAHSFKEISALTFFASLLNATWLIADVFLSVRAEKQVNLGYVLARVGDGLSYLALGLIICIALYSAAMFFQAALRRWDRRNAPPNQDGVDAESVHST